MENNPENLPASQDLHTQQIRGRSRRQSYTYPAGGFQNNTQQNAMTDSQNPVTAPRPAAAFPQGNNNPNYSGAQAQQYAAGENNNWLQQAQNPFAGNQTAGGNVNFNSGMLNQPEAPFEPPAFESFENSNNEETKVHRGIPVWTFLVSLLLIGAGAFFIGRKTVSKEVLYIAPVALTPTQMIQNPTATLEAEQIIQVTAGSSGIQNNQNQPDAFIPVSEEVTATEAVSNISDAIPSAVNTADVVEMVIVHPTSAVIPTAFPTITATSEPLMIQQQAEVAATPAPATSVKATIQVKGDIGAMLMQKPRLESSVMETLLNGTEVTITGQTAYVEYNNWVQVTTSDGYTGWVLDFVLSYQ